MLPLPTAPPCPKLTATRASLGHPHPGNSMQTHMRDPDPKSRPQTCLSQGRRNNSSTSLLLSPHPSEGLYQFPQMKKTKALLWGQSFNISTGRVLEQASANAIEESTMNRVVQLEGSYKVQLPGPNAEKGNLQMSIKLMTFPAQLP